MVEDKGVQSIERALDIIEALSESTEAKSLTQIASEAGLHKSTTHRIMTTLLNRGYVAKDIQGRYRIGLKLIEAASCHIGELELQTEARPYVADITSHLGLTSYLGVLDGEWVVYIEKIDMASAVKLYSQIGKRVHAYCSSLGKCLLSNYSAEELEEVMKDCSFIKFTENTIENMDMLHKEIAEVRERGWAMDDGEYEEDHRCVGAPIYDYRGEIVAAVSASGDKHIFTDDMIEEASEYVMKTANDISRALGYPG